MKEKLDKSKLKKIRMIGYETKNTEVLKAEFAEISYDNDRIIYQPVIINVEGNTVISDTGFYNIEEAKKCVDNYKNK